MDVGPSAAGDCTPNGARKELQGTGPSLVVIATRYKNPEEGLNHVGLIDEVVSLCELSGIPYRFLDGAYTSRWHESSTPIYPTYGVGDISFASNAQNLLDDSEGWTSNSYPHMTPCSIEDVFGQDFRIWLRQVSEYQVATALVSTTAIPSIEEEDGTFDQIEDPRDFSLWQTPLRRLSSRTPSSTTRTCQV